MLINLYKLFRKKAKILYVLQKNVAAVISFRIKNTASEETVLFEQYN